MSGAFMQVVKEVAAVAGSEVRFIDGETRTFDAIIFATGYRSTAADWLKALDLPS